MAVITAVRHPKHISAVMTQFELKKNKINKYCSTAVTVYKSKHC